MTDPAFHRFMESLQAAPEPSCSELFDHHENELIAAAERLLDTNRFADVANPGVQWSSGICRAMRSRRTFERVAAQLAILRLHDLIVAAKRRPVPPARPALDDDEE